MNKLEARYRRLLTAYPVEHRHQREDEMVSVLLDVSRPGQTRPSLRQATAIVAAGLACRTRSTLNYAPTPARWALVTAVGLGLLGAVVGLVVGLAVHPPTAWFAVLEVGGPSAVIGALLGFAAGSIAHGVHRLRSGPGAP